MKAAMDKNADLKRYELFGWDYESVNELTDAEVGWHRKWAKRTGGPALGLACGTGRLLCRLAQAGLDVTGLDLSDTMLHLARANVAKLPAAARKRVRLVRADMSDFDERIPDTPVPVFDGNPSVFARQYELHRRIRHPHLAK